MGNWNLRRLTIICYLLTTITGAAVVLPFVVKDNAALLLNSTQTYAGYVFSFFMVGMLLFEYCNGFIIKFISIKTEIFIICGVYVLCVISMAFISNMQMLIPILFILGLVFGMATTLPNYVFVNAFKGSSRSSRLNRNDMFFSIGSFVIPFIAGYMLADSFTWIEIYASVFIALAVIIILLCVTKFPDLEHTSNHIAKVHFSKWTLNVYLIGFAIFFYFVSYVGFTYWLQGYLTSIGIDIKSATLGVTLFWLFYGIGCYISSFAIKFIAVQKYVVFSAIISCFSYFFIFYNTNVILLYILVSILGLGCSTIYSSSISYGSLLLNKPSPRVISFFITTSGIGTFVGEFYSSYIQHAYGFSALVAISAAAMILTIILYLYVMRTQKINIDNGS